MISGYGRTGTSFLVALLTRLGLDTGFTEADLDLPAPGFAGLEGDVRSDDSPYVVKSPFLNFYIDEVLAKPDIRLDVVLIPVRDLAAAAASRERVSRLAAEAGVPPLGGLIGAKDAADQVQILARQLHRLVERLSAAAVPMVIIQFPRLARDPAYLYEALHAWLPGVDFATFQSAFERTARPELIHDFDARPA